MPDCARSGGRVARHRAGPLAAVSVVVTVLLAFGGFGVMTGTAGADSGTSASSSSGRRPYLVTLAAAHEDALSFAAASNGLRSVRGITRVASLGVNTVQVTTNLPLARLRALPGVASVEADRLLAAASLDPLEPGAWYLDNPSSRPEAATVDADIDVNVAWTRSTGAGVIVAVADSGFEINHPDLSDQWVRNLDDDCGDSIDDDRNGFVDDCRGWDFGMSDGDVSPGTRTTAGSTAVLPPAHGTQVAGIVAAARNGRGTTGVAPDARILPLKVSDGSNRLWLSAGIGAMAYAAEHGAKVFVASWGSATGSSALSAAVATLEARGMLLVAAAGNGGHDLGTSRQWYPAGYATTMGGVVSVAATDGTDTLASFSNRGAVTLAAPGARMLTTTTTRTWTTVDGTSFAAPVVAGVAALLAASEPSLTPSELRARLEQGSEHPSGLVDAGAGRINAASVLGLPPDASGATLSLDAPAAASNGVRVPWSDPWGVASGGVEFIVAGPGGDIVERSTLPAGGGVATSTGLGWDADYVVTLQPLPAVTGVANWTSTTLHTPAAVPAPRVTVHATENAVRIQIATSTLRGARVLRYEIRWPDRTTILLPGSPLTETVVDLVPNTAYTGSVAVIADTTAEGVVPISFVTAVTVAGPTARLTPTVEGVDVAVTPQRSLPGRPPITGYLVTADGRSLRVSPSGKGTLRGLVPGVPVDVLVTALHGTLEGTSAIVGAVTPYGPVAPDAPLDVQVAFQSSNLVVRWNRPPGPLITSYTVTVNGKKTQVPATTGFTVVKVGTVLSATVEVTARNGWGTSPAATATVDR